MEEGVSVMGNHMANAWSALCRVRSLAFIAQSSEPTGRNGHGRGVVAVQAVGTDTVIFTESGLWKPDPGGEMRFRNVFRWSALDRGKLRLEHLRYGVENPVYLFDLAPAGEAAWSSTSPHLCREDCYSADMMFYADHIAITWSIRGPRKNELVRYEYSLVKDTLA
jgi:Family of unknown function (DUF6314)